MCKNQRYTFLQLKKYMFVFLDCPLLACRTFVITIKRVYKYADNAKYYIAKGILQNNLRNS